MVVEISSDSSPTTAARSRPGARSLSRHAVLDVLRAAAGRAAAAAGRRTDSVTAPRHGTATTTSPAQV